MAPTDERVFCNGSRVIPSVDTGSGKSVPLVLLHSMGSDRRSFLPTIETLRATRRCIAPDLSGHGLRAGADTWNFEETVQDIVAIVVQLETAVDLLGVSLGGAVAQAVAARIPDSVRKLVLACTFTSLPHGAARLATHTTAARDNLSQQEWAADRARSVLVPTAPKASFQLLEEIYSTVDRRSFLEIAQSVYGIDVSDIAKTIDHEALVIRGARDDRLPSSVTDALVSLLANGRALELAEAGHLPHLDRPDTFASVVLEFLNDPAPELDEKAAKLSSTANPDNGSSGSRKNSGRR